MDELKQAIEVFEKIKNTSGKNDKIEIIKENGESRLFRGMLNMLFNDYIRTGLALGKINKKVDVRSNIILSNIEHAMVYVVQNNTGTDQVISNIQAFINGQDEEIQEFLKSFFTKTYKCGITCGSVNKALGKGTIQEFGCQLAHPYEKHAHKITGDFFITQKLDGHRTLAFIDPGENIVFTTRKGHEIDGLEEINAAIKQLILEEGSGGTLSPLLESGFVLDGEVVINDSNIPVDKIFQETSKVLKKDGVKKDLQFNVFDLIPLDQFKSGQSECNYSKRRHHLDMIFKDFSNENLVLVETLYAGSDKEEVVKWSNKATDYGWEGVMLNDSKSVYKTKRTPGLLKVKKFFSSDVKVIDVYEGGKGTRLEGTLGGVVIQFKDFTVNVGSGFSDDERNDFWKHKDMIVGQIIEVQYFEETSNQKDGKSLRFPTYKGIREDKTEEDISYES